jgi:hypothetical protein
VKRSSTAGVVGQCREGPGVLRDERGQELAEDPALLGKIDDGGRRAGR